MKRTGLATARNAALTAGAAAMLFAAGMILTGRAEAQAPLAPVPLTLDYCGVLQDAWVIDFAAYQNATTIDEKQAAWQALVAEQEEWFDAMCAYVFGDIGYLPKEPQAFY